MAGIHRSGYPNARNWAFLDTLKLRSILLLSRDPLLPDNVQNCQSRGIHVEQISMVPNTEPFVTTGMHELTAAVRYALDTRNHPVLIHCTRGINRTGVVVACIRKVQHVALSSVLAEMRRFGDGDECDLDEQLVDLFDPTSVHVDAHTSPWVM